MSVIAVAGGTSAGIGRSILTQLNSNPNFTPIVLTRETSEIPKWLSDLKIVVKRVNYQSRESLVDALRGVHTVISVLLPRDGTWASTQIELLNASIDASVSRFVPAEWGPGPKAAERIQLLSPQLELRQALRDAKAKNANFEWAAFRVGMFMNYLGIGAKDEESALAGKRDDGQMMFYVKEMRVEIPETADGAVPSVSMTEITDIGRFVAAACELPEGEWQEDFSCVGDTLPVDRVAVLIEKVRGGKVSVITRTKEQIEKDKEQAMTDGEFYRHFWLELEEMYTRNEQGESVIEPKLNKLCPNVRPITVEEYLIKFW